MNGTCSRIAATLLAAGLTGCGGGGGDGGSPRVEVPQGARDVAASAGSDVNAANAVDLGELLAIALLSSDSAGLVDPTGSERAQPMSAAPALLQRSLHARLLQRSLGAFGDATRKRANAVNTSVEPCLNAGGTLTVTDNDADNNGKLSAGDTLQLRFANCVLDPSLPAAGGTISITVNAVELDARDEPVALDLTALYGAFTLAGYGTLDGRYQSWSRPEGANQRFRTRFDGTVFSSGGTNLTYNFDVYGLAGASSGSFEVSGGLGFGGQTYSVVPVATFSYSGFNPPSSGAARLRDAAGDAVQLTARSSTSFDLAYFPSGATTPSFTLPGLLWQDYGP